MSKTQAHMGEPLIRATHSRMIVVIPLALLLLAVLAGLFSGSTTIANAIAMSLVVFALYLIGTKLDIFSRSSQGAASEIARFETCLDPVFISDLYGKILARNPLACKEDPLAAWGEGSSALIYRLCREAGANGFASEHSENGEYKITALRYSKNTLLWRVLRRVVKLPQETDFSGVELAWVRINANEKILDANAAARALVGGPANCLSDILSDTPLRGDGLHIARKDGQAIRALMLSTEAGIQELLLVPLGSSEISGLAPDQFLEELPVALLRIDLAGRISYSNKAAQKLMGEDAAPGRRLADIIEGMARSIPERLEDALKGRGLGRPEVAKRQVGDQESFLQVVLTKTIHGGETTILAVVSDATELKTLEAQFVQSQKMQAVGQLAGGVAHDFNNLLTAINGHCDLLLMRHDVADAEHGDLMQIRQNANRAAALVRQLLAFSRKQTLRPRVINLQDTLSELAHLLNRLLSEKVTLTISHEEELAPVRVDERQFEQVLMNLVVNARDAMANGGEVRVTTENVDLKEDLHRDRAVVYKGKYVVVKVIDSGTGIPKDKLNKIFEPFYTTKQVGEGTGLGLSTVYGIIKQTGGFIFVDSPPEGGAIFSIYLPAYEKADMPEPVAEDKTPRDLTGRGMVMLVEDEDPVRSFAARALELRGYTVVEAASGEEALEILKDASLHIDIMLSDVIMPGLDGPAWVREARKTRKDAKVIFMSGYTEDVFNANDKEVADAAFLPKPFTLAELTQRVKDTLEGEQ